MFTHVTVHKMTKSSILTTCCDLPLGSVWLVFILMVYMKTEQNGSMFSCGLIFWNTVEKDLRQEGGLI